MPSLIFSEKKKILFATVLLGADLSHEISRLILSENKKKIRKLSATNFVCLAQ